MKRLLRARSTPWTLVCLTVCLASCGGGGSNRSSSPTAPTPPTASAPPAPRVIAQGGFSLGAPSNDSVFFGVVPITDAATGNWEATVDWTFPDNTLWMYVATGTCSPEQFASDACPSSAACPCQFAVRSEAATPKPRVLSIPNAPGGTRTLIILNLGPREETGTIVVRLTPTTTGTASVGETAPASRTAMIVGSKRFRK
jgi:hypothetical protein